MCPLRKAGDDVSFCPLFLRRGLGAGLGLTAGAVFLTAKCQAAMSNEILRSSQRGFIGRLIAWSQGQLGLIFAL